MTILVKTESTLLLDLNGAKIAAHTECLSRNDYLARLAC